MRYRRERPAREPAITFVELLVVAALVMILASAVMPLAKVTATRTARGRVAPRAARNADGDRPATRMPPTSARSPRREFKVGAEGYPPDLDTLVEGVAVVNDATGRKLKFLRRIPVDPMTHDIGMGQAFVSGRTGRDAVGRPERIRRLHHVRGNGARWDQVP